MNKTKKTLVDSNIDIETLLQLLKSGHLYTDVKPEPKEEEIEALRKEALAYVGIIRKCVNPIYEQTIDKFWQKLVKTEWLSEHLALESGKNRGRLNRNNLFVVIDDLCSSGVYKASSSLQLFYMLEGPKKNSIYTRKDCYLQYFDAKILVMIRNFAKNIVV